MYDAVEIEFVVVLFATCMSYLHEPQIDKPCEESVRHKLSDPANIILNIGTVPNIP